MDAPIKLIGDFTFMGVTISAEVPLREAEIGFGKNGIFFSGDFTKAKAEVLADDGPVNGEPKAEPEAKSPKKEPENEPKGKESEF